MVCVAGGCVCDVEAASASHVFAVGDGVCGVEFAFAHECAAFVRGDDCVHQVLNGYGVGCRDSCVDVQAVFDF